MPRRTPEPRPRAALPRAEPLTRERIAEAALALIDESGLEACSMRRLGARLGVEAMALYHHFPAKGPLLDAVMDRLLDELDLPPRGQVRQLERLRRVMRSYRTLAIRHPQAFMLLAARRFNTERTFDVYETILEIFADLGLDTAQSARWFRLFGGYVSGAALAEVASRERVKDPTPPRLENGPGHAAHPHVRAVAPHLRIHALDDVFEFGLGVLIDALADEVAGRRGETPVG